MNIGKRVRAWLEQRIEKYYDGPEPPARYAQQAELYAQLNPEATAEEWKAFAIASADLAYREAYVRGFEWRERDLDAKAERDELDRARHDWEMQLPERQKAEQQAPDRAFAEAFHNEGVRTGGWWVG